MQQNPLHILICPLDWGLGHAARCIPIINELLDAGHKVTIAGYGRSLIMLQKEFPLLESIELKGFSPSYSINGNMVLHLFLRLPQFITSILREHHELNTLIFQHHIDIIISDNRYGLWNKKIKSILITHQVMIKTPAWLKFLEYLLYRVSRLLISRFDESWIPDEKEGPELSGDLSHKYALPTNAKFIGPLSRFRQINISSENNLNKGTVAAIISGPEPQRSIFEKLLSDQLKDMKQPAIIIGGKPESDLTAISDSTLTIQPYLAKDELKSVILSSALVICRSGYSSIMDLQALGAKALFVPTPGQTEQVYLAMFHQMKGATLWCEQENMNLKKNIPEALKFPGFKIISFGNGLTDAISELKKK